MASTRSPANARRGPQRGMWVWNFPTAISDGGEAVLQSALKAGVTDLYLYVPAAEYQNAAVHLRQFNSKADQLGIRVWGLDGARAYFHDAEGSAEFNNSINNLIQFNAAATEDEQFVGFQADNEPADRDGYTSFHNGIADSKLTSAQTDSRQELMHDWLSMHANAASLLHRNHARFGAAMPHWLSHYEDEPIMVRYPTPSDAPAQVMHHMMQIVDDYVVMSYNTNVDVVMHLMHDVLTYAGSLPPAQRPAVHSAVETECGIGANVSYGDAPSRNSRDAMLGDIATVSQALALKYESFAGVSIHHFSAWEALEP